MLKSSRQTTSGQSSEHTTSIKGKRQRSEYNNGATQMVNLTQCDLRRSVRIMPQSQTFMIDSWQAVQSVEPTTTTSQTQAVTKGGVITITYTVYVLLTALSFSVALTAEAQSTRPQDAVGLEKKIHLKRGSIPAVLRGQIKLGTVHRYYISAAAGRQMTVVLKTGSQTSFTVSADSAGILEGADGVRQTVVKLPESGDYLIEIGTDRTVKYTLEVAIK